VMVLVNRHYSLMDTGQSKSTHTCEKRLRQATDYDRTVQSLGRFSWGVIKDLRGIDMWEI
jgi:hypothetical protein